jgi:lysophospholipase L1-like esterase
MTTANPNRRRGLTLGAGVFLLAGLVLSGCAGASGADESVDQPTRATSSTVTPSTSPSPTRESAPPSADPKVYVAVGASETVGVGAKRPARQAWPRVLHDRALPHTRYVNVGVSGSTVAEAVQAQLPRALAVHPDVVTVWLAVNDITHLVPVEVYEQQLRTLVQALRQGGDAQVYVGNVPPVDRLPAYRACLPSAPADAMPCALPVVPPPVQVRQVVTSYNQAIERVVDAEGATLVDLSRGRDLTDLTSSDGFHPSTKGHQLVAAVFASEIRKTIKEGNS